MANEPRPHLRTFDDQGLQEQLEQEDDTSPGGRTQPRSIEPGDEICEPVIIERRRRKFVDDGIFRRLKRIHQTQKLIVMGIGTMVVLAVLEYANVIGPGPRPIWARAVIDGLAAMFGIGK